MIDVGIPCSQLRGAFHGLSERFSGSVLAQPVRQKPARIKSRKRQAKEIDFMGQ
jgi:hypothetical protein